MFAFQFAIAENPDHLAARRPGHANVFPLRIGVIGQNDQCGKLIGIHEKRDAFDVVLPGSARSSGLMTTYLAGMSRIGTIQENAW